MGQVSEGIHLLARKRNWPINRAGSHEDGTQNILEKKKDKSIEREETNKRNFQVTAKTYSSDRAEQSLTLPQHFVFIRLVTTIFGPEASPFSTLLVQPTLLQIHCEGTFCLLGQSPSLL